MRERLKLALLRWLLNPSGGPGRIDRGMCRTIVGPMTIVVRPMDTTHMTHDAQRAIHCGDYTVFFYDKTEEWKP